MFKFKPNQIKYSYSKSYTEIPATNPYQAWQEGMVGGNGLNGFITSGAPYNDTYIFQYMWYNFPAGHPREIPTELKGQLDEARQNVFKLNDGWKIKDENGETRKRSHFYCYHPGHQIRLTSDKKSISDYERRTNYETAEVSVKYTDKNGEWERVAFTSREDNVTVTKITKSSTCSKINMVISIDDLTSLRISPTKISSSVYNAKYEKIVCGNCDYIAQVVRYPSFEVSELANGGYAGVTRIIVEGGRKERVVLDDTNETINIGTDKNPAVKITEADAVYLITECDRSFDMDSGEMLNELLLRTKVVQEKYTADNVFDYAAALLPSAKKQAEAFNRVSFTLNGDEQYKAADNDAIINAQKDNPGRLNQAFLERIYAQGRYAQICCAGHSAPRLCGMWTGEWVTKQLQNIS